jgi:hypothetical protein
MVILKKDIKETIIIIIINKDIKEIIKEIIITFKDKEFTLVTSNNSLINFTYFDFMLLFNFSFY